MEIFAQCVGIDISKATFTACLCKRYQDGSFKLSAVVQFDNSGTGYNQLLKWQRKLATQKIPVKYTMEATGIYYEKLAYKLSKLKKHVSVVLPNKIVHYAKSLNVKSKTDPIDAKVISQFGAERNLHIWSPPISLYKELREYTRLYEALKHDKTIATNRLKHLQSGHKPFKLGINTYQSTIKRLNKQLADLESRMVKLLKSDPEVWSKVENLETIKGLGVKTIAIVLGETQGFDLIRNQRQLVSYCGLDVVQRESGSSIKGKSRISKIGNSHVRAALYFPAMVASRYNSGLSNVYKRVNKNKSSKKVGIVALQRRLLVLMYALWKTNSPYIEDYQNNRTSGIQEEEVSSSSSNQRFENQSWREKK